MVVRDERGVKERSYSLNLGDQSALAVDRRTTASNGDDKVRVTPAVHPGSSFPYAVRTADSRGFHRIALIA